MIVTVNKYQLLRCVILQLIIKKCARAAINQKIGVLHEKIKSRRDCVSALFPFQNQPFREAYVGTDLYKIPICT
jgi:hypothetical protein